MTRARLGALAVGVVVINTVGSDARAQVPQPSALIVLVDDAAMEDLLASPPFRGLAGAGGIALLSESGLPLHEAMGLLVLEDEVRGGPIPIPIEGLSLDNQGSMEGADGDASPEAINAVASSVRRDLMAAGLGRPERLLIVASASPPTQDEMAGDELGAVIFARGTPDALAEAMAARGADVRSLTSDSTRREGIVVTADIVTTVAEYLGDAAPDGNTLGSRIRLVDAPAPFDLHERYLAQRRMYVPIGIAAGTYVALMGLLGIACVVFGARIPWSLRRAIGWGCLTVAALSTALLAAGHLPDLSYATVVPFLALVTVLGTLAFAPLEARDVLLVPVGIGIAVLAYFLLEATLEWTAALTPFVGGSELDGGRFYGLPNAFIGLLIGSALWVAQRLPTNVGFALIVALGLFVGLPFAGANLGGAVSLFAAAGLWLAVRERDRLGVWRGIGVAAGVTLIGTVAVLGSHAISPIETHVTRFEEQVNGLGAVFERFRDRAQVGFDLIARNPFALIPVIGLPLAIAVVLRPPAALRPVLEHDPAWRDAILVTLLAGVVAYLANDSGPAAAGLAFGLGLGGLFGVSLLSGARKIEEP